MTIRLTCNIDNTKELLTHILKYTSEGERVMFLCDTGRGRDVIQRARVMLSRKRKQLEQMGRKRKYFNLHNTVHPHTENGKRYDSVVVWRSQNDRHSMLESLEDLIGNGEKL